MMQFGNVANAMEYQELAKMAKTCSLCNGKGYARDFDNPKAKWILCYDCLGKGAY